MNKVNEDAWCQNHDHPQCVFMQNALPFWISHEHHIVYERCVLTSENERY